MIRRPDHLPFIHLLVNYFKLLNISSVAAKWFCEAELSWPGLYEHRPRQCSKQKKCLSSCVVIAIEAVVVAGVVEETKSS